MKKHYTISLIFSIFLTGSIVMAVGQEAPHSDETQACIMCHAEIHPGITADWSLSRHAIVSPAEAEKKNDLEKRMSSYTGSESMKQVSVGCYECHSINNESHEDAFEHNGFMIHTIVSPNDCAVCHGTEHEEYKDNIMSHAYGNLMNNSLYSQFRLTVNAGYKFEKGKLSMHAANSLTNEESCLYCHGTKTKVEGIESRETDYGEMDFPVISGWPNQGVGRINPDGSKGSCSACHTRHKFSVATARKPYTCAQCHKGPDVPAYKVYKASKHGNLFESMAHKMNFDAIPWTVGKDFQAPTCAVCHISLITDENQNVIANRTHRMNDRLAWRLFGVPYAHPHPEEADLSNIKNAQNLPIPVELSGEPVSEFLISEAEQESRTRSMKQICKACHAQSWADTHFKRLHNTIENTNSLTLTATQILSEAWDKKYASGLPQGDNIFDESIERQWTEVWLFYANSSRFASAMGGGGDYGVFADGRFQLSQTLRSMYEWLQLQEKLDK